MAQIIFLLVALLAIALIVGLLVAVVRFPKVSLILGVIVVSGSVIYYKQFETQHRLSFIPTGLAVEKILYANDQSWGFGPGGNETGVFVYELPDKVAQEIRKDGIGFFTNLVRSKEDANGGRRGYGTWQETPHILDTGTSDQGVPLPSTISNYLSTYGFGIPIDSQIENEIDTSLSHSGTFFAYRRRGILIVIPKSRRVIYAYRG
jgi:hypothetical protein